MSQVAYPFKTVLEVMKPSKIDKTNPTHVAKFEAALLDSSPYWLEEKIDGCHYMNVHGRFFSTHINNQGIPVEKTGHFPHIREALSAFADTKLILDGEINFPGLKSNDVTKITGCAVDEALRRQQNGKLIHYRVFDILRLPNGEWLIDKPLAYRKQILLEFAPYIETSQFITINKWFMDNKKARLEQWLQEGREGGVLKHKEGLYVCGQRPMWNQIKAKQELEDDVILIGYNPPERLYKGKNIENWPYWENDEPVTAHYHHGLIGSLVIGKYNKNNELVPIGKVTGLNETLRADLTNNPNKYLNKVIKIKAMEMTRDGAYRHANFVMFHPDKNPTECVLKI